MQILLVISSFSLFNSYVNLLFSNEIFLPSGSIDNGVIEITNCFCVPHTESEEEVSVQNMYCLVIELLLSLQFH